MLVTRSEAQNQVVSCRKNNESQHISNDCRNVISFKYGKDKISLEFTYDENAYLRLKDVWNCRILKIGHLYRRDLYLLL